MKIEMGAMEECAECEGLPPAELFLCASPSARHKSLLASYRMNLKRGRKAVCDMIVGDLWRFMELGARERAADLLLVLRLFLADCPKGRSLA
ncbi:MAG TPA: hypothetical protein VEH76_07920 [Methylocystis sp.]|nr:hypothetical protein [Methylocystis sp.]